MSTEIKMPQLGQTSDEVRLIKWMVKEGDPVKKGQPLCEVETDKVTMELESIADGNIEKIMYGPDSEIRTGQTIALISDVSEVKSSGKKLIKEISLKGTDLKDKEVKTVKKIDEISSIKSENKKFIDIIKNLKVLNIKEKREIFNEIGKVKALDLYRKMLEIREFEEAIKALFLEGKMPGTIHQYMGMEACAVGVCSALKKDDIIASTHRPNGHAIARGIPIKEIMAELFGRSTGCCKGKGGAMHIGDLKRGMLPAIAVVGANIPIIGGIALAFKLKNESRVAISFFGDGATNEGAFHEALNMASIYNIPAVFICENNLYGASTSIKQTLNIDNIAERACAYGIRGDIADGMDVFDVYKKSSEAIETAREKHLPTLLELKTFRLCGHSRRDPCNYMTKEEKDYWQSKDPIILYEDFILKEKIFDSEELDAVKQEAQNTISKAIDFAQKSPFPEPDDIFKDLYLDMEVPR